MYSEGQENDLVAVMGDATLYHFGVTYNDDRLDLTPYTVQLVFKPGQFAADSAGTTFTTVNGLTITDATAGLFTWSFAMAYSQVAGAYWWHGKILDLYDNAMTFGFGQLNVLAV